MATWPTTARPLPWHRPAALHDIFNYTASDGHGGTSSAALDVTLNRGPDANADVAGVSKGGRVSGNVLANDFDSDGDAIRISGIERQHVPSANNCMAIMGG